MSLRKSTLIILIIACLFSLSLILPVSSSGDNKRAITVTAITDEGKAIDLYNASYALVIGNGEYTKGWDKLTGPIQDVKEVAAALEKNGFKVVLKTNLTKNQFLRTFGEFAQRYGKDPQNRILFYYAGHGHTEKTSSDDDVGYLVMVDAPTPDKDEVGFSLAAVDMQSLVTQAKMIRAKHVLFMFDSCFSGTILNFRDRIVPQAISENVKYPVRQFITAGSANEPVPDRSVFKQAFLDLLEGRDRKPIANRYLTGEELGFYLKNKVPEYNPSQHPQYGKIRDPRLDKGDFVFVLAKADQKEEQLPTSSTLPQYDEDKRRITEEKELLKGEKQLLQDMRALLEEKKKLEDERRQLEVEKNIRTSESVLQESEGKKKQVAEEKERLKQQKDVAEQLKALEEEKRKLDSQRRQVEEQRKIVAYAPGKDAQLILTKKTLRSTPSGSISESYIKNVITKHDFFDRTINPSGSFQGDLVDNGDGTVTDNITGLMWQKDGSRYAVNYSYVEDHVNKINGEKFARYSDWRLPTIEECASLLKNKKKGGALYIDPVFSKNQYTVWSSDITAQSGISHGTGEIWRVSFEAGDVRLLKTCITPCPGQRSSGESDRVFGDVWNRQYFVRAVRTVK